MKRLVVFIVRLSPALFVCAAAIAYVLRVEGDSSYGPRNTLPIVLAAILAARALASGDGHWRNANWRWLLGAVGFAIPALGLSLYLHWGYAVDLNGMYSGSVYPQELFRYLPLYTTVAGAIGFAIGWIAGSNV